MESEDLIEHRQFEELIQGLIDNQYGCIDNFIQPSLMSGLSANMQGLIDAGRLRLSGIGNQVDFKKDRSIRGDKINWIQTTSVDPFELLYLTKIGKFISHLNATCFTSITSFESHYSSYNKSDVYKRHLDQFKTEKGRKFSIVLYLNQDWTDVDGGLLSLYIGKDQQKDISPLGGRMVFFRSDEMEHEVHASSTRERRSIAGWLKN